MKKLTCDVTRRRGRQKTEVEGQRTEVGRQRSEIRSQLLGNQGADGCKFFIGAGGGKFLK